MTKNELTEFIAILTKLEIENNMKLTEFEKELYKQIVDELKKMAKQ